MLEAEWQPCGSGSPTLFLDFFCWRRTHMSIYKHVHTYVYTQTHSHGSRCVSKHMLTHKRAPTYTCIHEHTYSHTHSCSYTCLFTGAHTHTYICMLIGTHKHAHTHALSLKHTGIFFPSSSSCDFPDPSTNPRWNIPGESFPFSSRL